MRGKRNGFTLIELLVVVSIIALLVSILLPSLSKAREQAKSAVCMSHIKQIGIALPMYVMDYNDAIPPYRDMYHHSADDSFTDPAGTTYTQYDRYSLLTTWFYPGAYSDPARDGDGFLGVYLSTHTGGPDGILYCPSMRDGLHSATFTNKGVEQVWYVDKYRSYALNLAGICDLVTVNGADWRAPVKYGAIKNPSELVYMCDSNGRAVYVWTPRALLYDIEGNTATTPALERHNGRFNVVILDGHVDSGTADELYTDMFFERED